MHHHITAVNLRSVVYAIYSHRLLRRLIQKAMIEHCRCASCPLLCRLEDKKHIVRKLLSDTTQIVHSTEHSRCMCIMAAQMLRTLLCRHSIDISPESNSLITSRVKIVYHSGLHADIYRLNRVLRTYLPYVRSSFKFFECLFRYRVQKLPVAFRCTDSFLHCLFAENITHYLMNPDPLSDTR